MAYADKYVSRKDDLPEEAHWAILKFSSVHIPGDERSRTAPGHGYPAHDEAVVNYEAYYTEEAWLAAIEQLEQQEYSRTSYKALKVSPVTVSRKIEVSVGK